MSKKEAHIAFDALGIPRPKGSLDRWHQERPTTKTWLAEVARAGRAALDSFSNWPRGTTAPVAVEITFWMPASPSAPDGWPTRARDPDLDKLCRGVLDAIQGATDFGAGIIRDDRQVVELTAHKRLCTGVQVPSASVLITQLEGADQ